jgi:transcriptional regulator with XRE-family HTH domain
MSTLRALREQRGWSQEDLGRLAGMSTRTIWRAEHPERGEPISLATVRRLAAIMGLTPEQMAAVWADGKEGAAYVNNEA